MDWRVTKVVLVLGALAPLAFLVRGASVATPSPESVVQVPSVAETSPSSWSGDSVDDPAVWVNAADPGTSLVIGNNKRGALEAYGLDGTLRQKVTEPAGFWGNTDIRGDLLAVANSGILLYEITASPSTPLTAATEARGNATTGGEGLCLWDAGAPGVSGGLFAINVQRASFRIRMHPLTDADNDGLLTVAEHVKEFYLGSEGEACVVDDAAGQLYVAEEDVGIWRYDLTVAGSGAPPRILVDSVGPHLAPDVEGLALAGDMLIASAQNIADPQASWFNVYERSGFSLVRRFRTSDGATSDDCDQTDGIAASTASLGSAFPAGLFVCQDGFNDLPRANQNFKLVPLEMVLP